MQARLSTYEVRCGAYFYFVSLEPVVGTAWWVPARVERKLVRGDRSDSELFSFGYVTAPLNHRLGPTQGKANLSRE